MQVEISLGKLGAPVPVTTPDRSFCRFSLRALVDGARFDRVAGYNQV